MKSNDAIIQAIEGFEITVKVNGEVRTFNLMDIFDIDDGNLSKEYMHQPGLYAFFSALLAKAELDADQYKLKKENEFSQADLAQRDDAENRGKKTTEAEIKALASLDERVVTLTKKELVAKYDAKLLRLIVDALKMRAEMLISLGAHQRSEINQADMRIKENSYKSLTEDAKSAVALAKSKRKLSREDED